MSDEKLTLGQYFKREREERGISLKEIEQKTKIPAQTLKFLEEDQVDVLPPRAFLRGFIQVISKEFDM
ncbi:MAG TPA: helix-turn-helix domain-containing protein, partial [Desulfomonilia bacterium]|nr:helix-turn-helix domain-containing protein [Desulfomonilia bacterium]